jgi:hypothetical protein
MNACWTILLAVVMAGTHVAQAPIAAPAAPPASGQNQMAQRQAPAVPAPVASTPANAPLALSPQLCPCYVPQPCPCDTQQPCGNVAPWSWQHDDQNDDQWPADHGG